MINFKEAKFVDDKTHTDSLENLVAQLGTQQDKRTHSNFVNNKRLSTNRDELDAMYRTDWLSGKVVDIIPEDMTREWREFNGDIDPEIVRLLVEEEERLQLVAKIKEADIWSRLYGTAFIIISVDDGLTPDQPLDISNLKPGSLRHLNVVDRHRMSTQSVQPIADPFDPNFGYPEFYNFTGSQVNIHNSRVIRFDGVKLPYDQFKRNNYFSDSVLDRLYDSLINFGTVANGSASMVFEANVDVVKIKGLMNFLQSPEGENLIRKRFTLAGMLKSFNNMMLLDSEEDFTTKTNSFAGLSELINTFGKFLAAATDMPATRLLGTSASGLNATGEGDLKNYYDMIRSKQNTRYKPKLNIIDRLMIRNLGLNADDDYSYEFCSLFQMTPQEIADIQLKDAQKDTIYINDGVVTEEIVAKELKQKGTYTNITDDYQTTILIYFNIKNKRPSRISNLIYNSDIIINFVFREFSSQIRSCDVCFNTI